MKSNIGHTQAAAGVAGVIKMVMAMRHGVLPRTLHVDEPTPQVDWSAGAVRLLTEAREWPELGRPRRAGVSRSGSAAPTPTSSSNRLPTRPRPRGRSSPGCWAAGWCRWWCRRAAGPRLAGQARRLASFLAGRPELGVLEVGRSLAATRGALSDRAVVAASGREEALAGLDALARGEPAPGVVTGTAAAEGAVGRTVLVFPGQGAQWPGMGADLLDASAVFAARMGECAAVLDPLTGWSLVDVVRRAEGAPSLDAVDVVQPVTFAVMVSLAAVWEACGVVPDAVVGHSQGEIAAACVAGGLSLEDAAAVVVSRARVIAAGLSGRGGMASVAAGVGRVRELVEGWPGRVEVAAVNGPASTVVAGDPEALRELVSTCEEAGVRARRIPVDYASHSAYVEAVEQPLREALSGVVPRPGRVPFYSTVTGGRLDTAGLDAGYWYRNLRRTVEFDAAVRASAADGHGVFVEASAHPVLVPSLEEVLEQCAAGPVVVTGTLRREESGPGRFAAALARLHVHGVPVDWPAVVGRSAGWPVDLPTYAFQRERYWLEGGGGPPAAVVLDAAQNGTSGGTDLSGRLAATPPAGREQFLLDVVRREVAAVLGHASADKVDPERVFREVGFDSLLAVELRNRLSGLARRRLPATMVFDHPTPVALARHLLAELRPDANGAGEFDGREEEFRRVLATTPLARFQELGLMDKLLQLAASPVAETAGQRTDDTPLIAEMDVDDLVERAMRKARNK